MIVPLGLASVCRAPAVGAFGSVRTVASSRPCGNGIAFIFLAQLLALEMKQLVARAMARLTEKERRVLILYYS